MTGGHGDGRATETQRHRDTELKDLSPITERIIGCAIEVHRVLRCGLFEATYRSALAIEFEAAGLSFVREVAAPAIYKGHLLGSYRIDFIVEDRVIVEVKSVERMVIAYLGVTKKRIGLLINFNSRLLKDGVQRIIR